MEINMYNDKLFKAFFTSIEARGMVSSFLSAITGIDKEKFINATYISGLEPTTITKKEKGKRTDVIVKVDNYNRIIVEMNNIETKSIIDKNVRYAFDLINRTTEEGKNTYSNVVLLNIDRFNKYNTKEPILDFRLRNEDGIIESNIYHSIHLIVENFTKENYNKIEKEIVKFVNFLNHTNLTKLRNDYKGDADYMAGVVKLEDYMKDPDVYGLLYEEQSEEEYIKEVTEFAMEKGMKQGIEKGIEQKTKESAIELHNLGIEDEKIIQALHVSQDQLEKYLKEK